MDRRLLTSVLAAFAFVAIGLAMPEIAQSAPVRTHVKAKYAGAHQSAWRHAKQTKRHAKRLKRSAKKIVRPATRRARPSARRKVRHLSQRRVVAHYARQRDHSRVGRQSVPARLVIRSDSWVGSSEAAPVFMARRTVSNTRSRVATDPAVGTDAYAWAGSDIVSEARRWIGGNPTGRRSLWCARFMNFVLQRAGYRGTGSDMARSFASYGHRVTGPRVGAIAVMARGRRGGHVGVVSGVDANGNPIIISGNHNNRVAEATYPRGRIRAYVMPRS